MIAHVVFTGADGADSMDARHEGYHTNFAVESPNINVGHGVIANYNFAVDDCVTVLPAHFLRGVPADLGPGSI